MTIAEIRKALDTHQIGAVELTKEYLKKIKKDTCNCFITVCENEAIALAHEAQKLIDKGNAQPLTGVPVSIKDNICTKDIKTTCGSRMLENFVPNYDATAVDRLKNQGCVILGKTNMDEFGMGSASQSSYFGGVKNPMDISKVPGGSSGGSAAAIKSGISVASLGSDTGGSVRQPAAFCGVVGMKPTYGCVSRFGLIPFASSLDQIGILAQTAVDTKIMLSVIAGYDKRDMTSKSFNNLHLDLRIKNLKIGIPKEFFEDARKDVSQAVLDAAECFKSLGAELVSCSMPSLKHAVSAYYVISSGEAASNLARFDGIRYGYVADAQTYGESLSATRNTGFGEEVKRRIKLGEYVFQDEKYEKALQIRRCIVSEYKKIFSQCDLMLTPTSYVTAYDIGSTPDSLHSENDCTVTQNFAGVPAISMPWKKDKSGMPIGFSLTADNFNDSSLLGAACEFERRFGHGF